MGLKYCLLALCATFFSVQGKLASYSSKDVNNVGDDDSSTPMVAFLCGKPAMRYTSKGWVRDETTDCMENSVKILEYCKKVYPKRAHEINNVVEANHEVSIDNWCKYGRSHCQHHKKHTVRPFKCLVGSFQSEALLVPNHCVFDHVHDSGECKGLVSWNITADKYCSKKKMVKQSSAILLPCGVGLFGGVEFVCCPKDGKYATENNKHYKNKDKTMYKPVDKYEKNKDDVSEFIATLKPDQESETESEDYEDSYEEDEEDYYDSEEDYYSDEEDEEEESETSEDESDMSEEQLSMSDEEDETLSTEDEESSEEDSSSYYDSEEYDYDEQVQQESAQQDGVPSTDAYTEYLHKPNKNMNEHDYFSKAKAELQKHHHEKVTKMMKEWAAARQRVQDMKNTDNKAAEKLNKEITARFQKTYQALEQEGQAEKKQLIALHQQRVQADLNERKRHAMEHYMANLQKQSPDAAQILKSLEHYIKTEQKDRMHTINHFKHLRDTEPSEAESIRQQTQDHLAIIDQRIQQSIEMLNRVPNYAKKIKVQVENFMSTFREIDLSIHTLLSKPVEKVETTAEEILEKYKLAEADSQEESQDSLEEVEDILTELPKPEVHTDKPELHKVELNKVQPALKPTKFDDEVMEDEHDHQYIEIKEPHVSHVGSSRLEAGSPQIVKMQAKAQNLVNSSSSLAIAIGCIAVFVVIVVGIIILRKRTQNLPVSHGFVDEAASSPEERHVTNMQMNGYENPTYKYFEMNGNQA